MGAFSDELSDGFIRRVHLEDNVGIVLKGDSGDELCEALKCAARGGRFLCRQITNFLSAAPQHDETERKLTPTETEILKAHCHRTLGKGNRGASLFECAHCDLT